MLNWKEEGAKDRLVAALWASLTLKPDYRLIAKLYGKGATYDSIEGQFRKIRSHAAQLQAENGGDGVNVMPIKKARKPRSPNKKQDGVISGRVEKNQCATPTKGKKTNSVKAVKEEVESSGSSIMEGAVRMQVEDMAGYEWGNGSVGDFDAEEV